jgi:hypothetical protein
MVKFGQIGIQTKLFNIASAIFNATKTAASRTPNQKIKYIEYLTKNKNGSNLTRSYYILLNFLGIIFVKLFALKYVCSISTSRTSFHGSHVL